MFVYVIENEAEKQQLATAQPCAAAAAVAVPQLIIMLIPMHTKKQKVDITRLLYADAVSIT